MDLESIVLSVHLTDKDKYCMLALICGIKINGCIKQNRNKLTDVENRLVDTSEERKEWRSISNSSRMTLAEGHRWW